MATIRVLLFAQVRELVGREAVDIDTGDQETLSPL